MKKVILLAASALALTACDTTSSTPYKMSTRNVIAFQQALSPTSTKVNVSPFTNGVTFKNAPTCRLMGPVDIAPGKTINQYLHDALQEELFAAQAYAPNAPVTLTGRIDEVDLNTMGTGAWTLAVTMTSNRDQSGYQVRTSYPFSSSFMAQSACKNAAAAFGPAVNNLIDKIVTNPGFGRLAGVR